MAIACILEYFVVEKLSRKLAFRMVSPEDKPNFYHTCDLFHDRMPDVPGDEFYCHLPLHASRQSDHRLMAAEDRPELPYGAVLADHFSQAPECGMSFGFVVGKNGEKTSKNEKQCKEQNRLLRLDIFFTQGLYCV